MRTDMYAQSSKMQSIKECMVYSEGLRGKKAHGQDYNVNIIVQILTCIKYLLYGDIFGDLLCNWQDLN